MPVGLSICFFKKAIWDVETNIFTDIFYSGMLAINPWNEQPWFSTGGTRTKTYVQFLDGKFYYFKRCLAGVGLCPVSAMLLLQSTKLIPPCFSLF